MDSRNGAETAKKTALSKFTMKYLCVLRASV